MKASMAFFAEARGTTRNFDRNNVVMSATTPPVCDCCKQEQRGKRFMAMVEPDPADTTHIRFVDEVRQDLSEIAPLTSQAG
eukprot:5598305-Prorocentrum_lima.AAC.1